MTKTLLAALAASFLALPVLAQTIEINDDGWNVVETPAAATMSVTIDDDGWTRTSAPLIRSDRGALSPDGSCTQLELSAGVSPDACATVSLSTVATMMGSGN